MNSGKALVGNSYKLIVRDHLLRCIALASLLVWFAVVSASVSGEYVELLAGILVFGLLSTPIALFIWFVRTIRASPTREKIKSKYQPVSNLTWWLTYNMSAALLTANLFLPSALEGVAGEGLAVAVSLLSLLGWLFIAPGFVIYRLRKTISETKVSAGPNEELSTDALDDVGDLLPHQYIETIDQLGVESEQGEHSSHQSLSRSDRDVQLLDLLEGITPSVPSHNFPEESPIFPEEQVRQYVLDELVNSFGYARRDIATEFPIKMGSSTKKSDIVIFQRNAPHRQANIVILVECKRADQDKSYTAEAQLKSYMAACLNARFGVVAASAWRVFERVSGYDGYTFERVKQLPDATGDPVHFEYQPY